MRNKKNKGGGAAAAASAGAATISPSVASNTSCYLQVRKIKEGFGERDREKR